MRDNRRLSLRRETLSQLTTDEMTAVAGASHLCGVTYTCTHGPSVDETCPTIPPTTCFVIVNPISRRICI